MLIQSTRLPQAKSGKSYTRSLKPQAQETPGSPKPDNDELLSPDAGQRIGRFVRGVTSEALQHFRYLSVASAFGQVGSTLGSVALTPLAIKWTNENAALIGGLGIGGTIVAGAIGAAIGYGFLHSRDKARDSVKFNKVADVGVSLGAGIQSLPKFIYPTVSGATAAQTETIFRALDALPLSHATASSTIEVVPGLVDTGISGMAQPGSSHSHLLLDESYINSPTRGPALIWHEQAHAVDYNGGFGLVGAHNWKAGFGKAPYVSNYASTNRYEDFAESYEAYYVDNANFKAEFPEKAAAIEEISHQDFVTSAADKPGIREAGKKIGQAFNKVPYSRTAAELAGSLMGPVSVYRGASKLVYGLENGNVHQQLDGKLNLATGLFLGLPGARPLALATSLVGAGIHFMTDKSDPKDLEAANKLADKVLTTSAGPVGMAVAATLGEMQSSGLRINSSQGFNPEGWKAARPDKKTMLKGTLATVGGTVAGAIAGAALGGAVSGHSGALLGALWGQAAGGAIGLGVYSIKRTLKKSDKGDPFALTAGDKRFLKGTIAGSAVAGTIGTVGGAQLGRLAGHALGMFLGDASTATTLSSIGGWVGGLAGAYGGSKLGAGLGSGRLLGRKRIDYEPPTDPEDKGKEPPEPPKDGPKAKAVEDKNAFRPVGPSSSPQS